MKNKLKILIILLIGIYGCCDCLDSSDPIPPFCNPQEATITQFIAEFSSRIEQNENGDDEIIYTPTPPFNVQGFLFPNELSTDERFDPESGIEGISFEEEFLPINSDDGGLKLAVLSGIPINEDQNADINVISVDLGSVPRTAQLRFKGRLNFFRDNQTSESSEIFCDFIEQNGIAMQELDLVRYGEDITDDNGNISTVTDYSGSPISVLSEENNILIEDIQNPDAARQFEFEGDILTEVELLNELNLRLATGNFGGNILNTDAYAQLQQRLNENEYESIDIEVEIGDVFVYEAMNGGLYAINVINIAERDNDPVKRRVSIQYSRL
jgi:hypothetical protein